MTDPSVSWGAGLTPDELAARLRAHPFADVREPLMHKITLLALRHSQPLTPVRTGHLRRSLTTRVEPGGLRGFVGSNVVYAAFVHEGTQYAFSQPFLADGIAAARGEIDKLIQDTGDEYLEGLT